MKTMSFFKTTITEVVHFSCNVARRLWLPSRCGRAVTSALIARESRSTLRLQLRRRVIALSSSDVSTLNRSTMAAL